jgi:hypothetical protein
VGCLPGLYNAAPFGSIEFIAIAGVVAALVLILLRLLNKIPTFFGWALIIMGVLLYVSFFIEWAGLVSGG